MSENIASSGGVRDEVPNPGQNARDTALIKRAGALAQSVEAFIKEAGYPGLGPRLAALKGRWIDGQVRIAVAGMQKRGKSRLINALLDRPDLVPVDEDVATDSHISIVKGDEFRAVVRFFGREPVEIPYTDLRDYASVKGGLTKEGHDKKEGMLGVEVTFNHQLLDGVRLFDTPGVDSLTMGHLHATKQVVAGADVLIFAVSGQDQPLLRHELDFLVEASTNVHRIAFALTKIDNAPRWQELLEANRERMRTHLESPLVGERAPIDVQRRLLDAAWFPVSSRRMEVAALRRSEGDTERADRLLASSGFQALIEFIRAAAAQRQMVRLGPLLDSLGVVLGTIEQTERDRLAAATEDDEALQRNLTEAREAVERIEARFQQRRGAATRISFLAGDAGRIVKQRIDDLRREYTENIQQATLTSSAQVTAYGEALPGSLTRSLDALWESLRAEVQKVADETLNEFVQSMGLDEVNVVLDASVQARYGVDTPTMRAAGLDPIMDGVPMVTLASSLAMISLHFVPFVGIILGPALAGAVAWKRNQAKVGQTAKADLTRFVAEALNQARDDFTATLSKLVVEKKAEIETEVDAELQRQRREIAQRAEQTKQLKNQDAATRRRSEDLAKARLVTLGKFRNQLISLAGDHPVHSTVTDLTKGAAQQSFSPADPV